MTHVDSDTHVAFIVLCFVESVVTSVGTNAVGEVGAKQLKAFHQALAAVPPDARQIFVVLHHPLVKRQGDRYGFPTRLTKNALLSSSGFEFATLPDLLSESREMVTALRDAAASRLNATLYLLFGHRHRCFLGKLTQAQGDGPDVWVSEAPANKERPDGRRISRACPLSGDQSHR